MSEIAEISLAELAALKKKKEASSRGRPLGLRERRADEAAAQRPNDGRIRPAALDRQGNVQLNVRVTPDVKNRVIDLARASGRDMSSVVEAAILAYLEKGE